MPGSAVTVKELIEFLQTLPQDYEVAHREYSDSSILDKERITVIHASDKEVIRHHNQHDSIRSYRSWEHDPDGEKPEFINVVMFPGN